ncbi:unnamed protein product [marine sediment metagenome]|uniref:SpoVT-AbrB domain-containing protein n=1 Tax=marine sediment metagenome TaxID=412755 RepID=X1PU82_9ZZZZ
METRKVIKIKNSLYINIPAEIAERWGIEKGDSWIVGHLPDYGILISRSGAIDRAPSALDIEDRLYRCADNIFSELRRKARAIEASLFFNIMSGLIGEVVKSRVPYSKEEITEIVLRAVTEELGYDEVGMLPGETFPKEQIDSSH